MTSLKRFVPPLITVFLLALMLNLAWEFLHSGLYVHYRGGAITLSLLARAALYDAAVITIISACAVGVLCRFTLRRLSLRVSAPWAVFVIGVVSKDISQV